MTSSAFINKGKYLAAIARQLGSRGHHLPVWGSQLVGHKLIYRTLEVRVLSPFYACRWDVHFQGPRSWDVGFFRTDLEP